MYLLDCICEIGKGLQMINYNRRRRQASENSNIIIERFAETIKTKKCLYPGEYCISSDAELMKIAGEIRKEVQEKARHIQPDWSIPIIMEAIAKLYYGKQEAYVGYGTTFKRALVYLWKANENSLANQKNLGSIEEVLHLSFVLEMLYGFRKFFLASEEFCFYLNEGYCTCEEKYNQMIYSFAEQIQGRGKRMRVAEVNSTLMCSRGKEFYDALFGVLDGEDPKKIGVFRDTFYEKIPGIADAECKRFWQSVFFRYSLFQATLVQNCFCAEDVATMDAEDALEWTTAVILFPEFAVELPEGLFTQEIVRETFWTREWVQSQDDEQYGNLIVERPVLRITPEGDFATASVLIGDSINYFIEGQIFNYSFRSPKINLPAEVFKNAFSAPFEEMVIESLRDLGFLAGHVTEEGTWLTQEKDVNLSASTDRHLYGEIDTLAYLPELNFAILVECKVLNDVRDYRSYKNIVSKLVDDSEGFQYKILDKRKWVNEALKNCFGRDVEAVCFLMTDIALPITNFSNEEIILINYEEFPGLIEMAILEGLSLIQ